MGAGALSSRFSTWLLRPYLDLGPFVVGPTHAQSVERSWDAFTSADDALFSPQRAMHPAFRVALAAEAGAAYALDDPRRLPARLRTPRWERLCAALDDWRGASSSRQARLVGLLNALCLYEAAMALAPSRGVRAADPHVVARAFGCALARYLRNLPERVAQYDDADMSVFVDIASNAPHAPDIAFNAAARVFVHLAKTGASLDDLETWGARWKSAHARVTRDASAFAADLMTSRFHRGYAFLPQRRGDRAGVAALMDAAEKLARGLAPKDAGEDLLRRENLHALMESRTKEAMWLGDLDLAHARAQEVVQVDPYDAKAWTELGQARFARRQWRAASEAFLAAATLGPPATALARHMAGMCFLNLGEHVAAGFLFNEALAHDPLGVSPRLRIESAPDAPPLDALKVWSRARQP